MPRTTPKISLLLLGLPLLLSACAVSSCAGPGPADGLDESATPHGYIAGAQENPEPQTGLLTLNRETGEGQLLSLLTGKTSDAGTSGHVDAAFQDGRYALLATSAGVQVFDTGAWTVDHGEHKHYYSAQPGVVGTLRVPDPGAVAGDGKALAVFSPSAGYASVYMHKDLDAGNFEESARITTTPHDGVVVPYEGHFLASVASGSGAAAGGVEVRGGDGSTVLGRQDCAGLSGHAATRVGVVFACTDGALLITEEDGVFAAEKISYPDGGAGLPPVTLLEHRPGSNELAGPAGEDGAWHLDVSKRKWTHLPTPVPVAAAAAVGDGKRVLAVGVDGSLLNLDPATGAVAAQVPLVAAPAGGALPQLRIDASRAYVSDPARSVVHEIDYADGLRVARTFEVPSASLMMETGL